LAPHETQRLVVSGKTGTYSSATPGKDIYVPIDPGGEMVTPLAWLMWLSWLSISILALLPFWLMPWREAWGRKGDMAN
jgi:hypothetical protein